MKTLTFNFILLLTPFILMSQNTLNGVNVDQLVGTIEAVKADADIAKFKFRSHTKWINGGHCETSIKEFYGAKQEDQSRNEPLVMVGDEPAVLLGTNLGPNAVEAVLHALSSCLSVGLVYNASAMGIKIYSLEFDLEGDLNLEAFLGLSKSKRPGYENIDVKIAARTSATKEEFQKLLEYVKETSPVLDIIKNPVPVNVNVDYQSS